jgi:thiamine-monophosphate kinase
VNELEIVERLRKRTAAGAGGRGLLLGMGDDCAVFRPRRREDLLFTTDMLLEDVHFRRETHPPRAVGRKALARALSDIAAMGGEPRFCLLSVALPAWAGRRWADSFFAGFLDLAKEAAAPLAGGDLARADRFTCDVVVCGSVPPGAALRRDGARPGDHLYISGKLGGSARGLETGRGRGWRKHLRPEPRLALGVFLRQRLRATAAMDLSDGLSLDLHRMCLASKVAARIDPPPRFPGASEEQALHGGEDYELLFTVRPRTRVPADFEGVPLTRIGAMVKGKPGLVLLSGKPLAALGWDHFASPPLSAPRRRPGTRGSLRR